MNLVMYFLKAALLVMASVACGGIYMLTLQLKTETEVRTIVTYELLTEVSTLRAQLIKEVDLLRQDMKQETSAFRAAAQHEIAMTRKEARQELAESREKLLAELHPVLQRTESLLATYEALPDRAAYANRWLWDCENYPACLQSQALALVGSARYTMGQIAKSAPKVATAVEATAQSAAATAQASAATANQVQQLTKPGPKWLRYLGIGASVAVPASQIAIPFIVSKIESGGGK